ncbi:hypothetical protein ACFVRD_44610 [Streptomyces sp. NPDC057908]|uniref:hypothetical protein n=1 Tax=Streptomyces sp. NPDC057908 TaxID=3346276 RepID=UPI0036E92D63
MADLVTDFADIRPLLGVPQPVATRVRLCRTAGQMAGMAAIVLHDLGSRREARAWFATAAHAAGESGDRQLHAWVMAREAMVGLNYGSPKAAAGLAEQARRVAGNSPTAAATLAAAVAARAYALSHQPDQARDALADADRLMERLSGEQRADTWFGHCEQKHHVHLSHALTALGDTGEVVHLAVGAVTVEVELPSAPDRHEVGIVFIPAVDVESVPRSRPAVRRHHSASRPARSRAAPC